MGINYTALASELTAGHPDQGAYNVDDQLAADQLNAAGAYTSWARPSAGTIRELFNYFAQNRSKLAAESNPTPLIGRLREVTETPIGSNTSWGETVTKDIKHAASLFYELARISQDTPVDLVAAELDDSYALMGPPVSGGVGVWKDPDTTAIQNISNGKQSRAQEIADLINYNGLITESHVANARAL